MSSIDWIREGDGASCGGTVKQGHATVTSDGQPVAHRGSPIACRKNCVVVADAHLATLPNGLTQALQGDKSSGGCPLISTLIGKHGIANAAGAAIATSHFRPLASALVAAGAAPEDAAAQDAVAREDGSVEHGTTDTGGHTHMLRQTLAEEHVRIFLQDVA